MGTKRRRIAKSDQMVGTSCNHGTLYSPPRQSNRGREEAIQSQTAFKRVICDGEKFSIGMGATSQDIHCFWAQERMSGDSSKSKASSAEGGMSVGQALMGRRGQ